MAKSSKLEKWQHKIVTFEKRLASHDQLSRIMETEIKLKLKATIDLLCIDPVEKLDFTNIRYIDM
jgi:hypothetical protein